MTQQCDKRAYQAAFSQRAAIHAECVRNAASDKQGGDNTVDGQMLKISLAKNTGVYSEEALAERMAHLLSQR